MGAPSYLGIYGDVDREYHCARGHPSSYDRAFPRLSGLSGLPATELWSDFRDAACRQKEMGRIGIYLFVPVDLIYVGVICDWDVPEYRLFDDQPRSELAHVHEQFRLGVCSVDFDRGLPDRSSALILLLPLYPPRVQGEDQPRFNELLVLRSLRDHNRLPNI